MNQRETVARALNRFLPLALCGPATDDVLAALGLGEGGENVVVPREPDIKMIGAWYQCKNGFHFPEDPPPSDTSDYAAYRAMLSARPEGEAGE